MDYNEQKAIDYIREHMPEGALQGVNDDEILNVIDAIWDYYEEKGLCDLDLNFDDEDDEDIDVDELVTTVKKVISKDKRSPLKADDIEAIVKAELGYEDTLLDD